MRKSCLFIAVLIFCCNFAFCDTQDFCWSSPQGMGIIVFPCPTPMTRLTPDMGDAYLENVDPSNGRIAVFLTADSTGRIIFDGRQALIRRSLKTNKRAVTIEDFKTLKETIKQNAADNSTLRKLQTNSIRETSIANERFSLTNSKSKLIETKVLQIFPPHAETDSTISFVRQILEIWDVSGARKEIEYITCTTTILLKSEIYYLDIRSVVSEIDWAKNTSSEWVRLITDKNATLKPAETAPTATVHPANSKIEKVAKSNKPLSFLVEESFIRMLCILAIGIAGVLLSRLVSTAAESVGRFFGSLRAKPSNLVDDTRRDACPVDLQESSASAATPHSNGFAEEHLSGTIDGIDSSGKESKHHHNETPKSSWERNPYLKGVADFLSIFSTTDGQAKLLGIAMIAIAIIYWLKDLF